MTVPNYNPDIIKELLRLVDQSMWANAQWIEFVYSQPDPEIRPRELLGHLLDSEKIWFERIEGEQKIQDSFQVLTKEELLNGFEENRLVFQKLISTRLEEDIRFKRDSGVEYHARVADIIQHLITHGYHHRGQLALYYARKGMKYPNTDHINFLIENKL